MQGLTDRVCHLESTCDLLQGDLKLTSGVADLQVEYLRGLALHVEDLDNRVGGITCVKAILEILHRTPKLGLSFFTSPLYLLTNNPDIPPGLGSNPTHASFNLHRSVT
ncbi:Hypothetical predicted protein [Pelobates cultripes]|uniref:Uncharacterized protein n=1 Tax=Pelobates cultripes TaxID=61616 RepID=A0AAD1TIU7_PELCU|nr:Hypothetical predicted protein [Pelobates cultripes]